MPEHRRLFPRLTVEENLKMGGFIASARSHFDDRLAYVYELFPRMKERRHQLAAAEAEQAGDDADAVRHLSAHRARRTPSPSASIIVHLAMHGERRVDGGTGVGRA